MQTPCQLSTFSIFFSKFFLKCPTLNKRSFYSCQEHTLPIYRITPLHWAMRSISWTFSGSNINGTSWYYYVYQTFPAMFKKLNPWLSLAIRSRIFVWFQMVAVYLILWIWIFGIETWWFRKKSENNFRNTSWCGRPFDFINIL